MSTLQVVCLLTFFSCLIPSFTQNGSLPTSFSLLQEWLVKPTFPFLNSPEQPWLLQTQSFPVLFKGNLPLKGFNGDAEANISEIS